MPQFSSGLVVDFLIFISFQTPVASFLFRPASFYYIISLSRTFLPNTIAPARVYIQLEPSRLLTRMRGVRA